MQGISRLQSFSVPQNGQWQEDGNMREILQWFNAQQTGVQSQGEPDNDGQAKAARDILYNVETLRKRPGAED
jgi:tRNA (guanine-N(7)-)-methyltransferase subunit TRM82